MDDQSRNLILATALSFLVILGWFLLGPILFPNAFPPPTEQAATPPATGRPPAEADPGGAAGRRRPPRRRRSWRRRRRKPRDAALAQTAAACRSAPPRLEGSLSLVGGRIDDLQAHQLHRDDRARTRRSSRC